MMRTSLLLHDVGKKRKYFSPIQIPLEVPFARNEHVWMQYPNGKVREYIMASQTTYLDDLGTELVLTRPVIRTSPFARFVRVSGIVDKPCKVWVLDSESHEYRCGILYAKNVFRPSTCGCGEEYELDDHDRVSLAPVHHSGYENGCMWSIQSNKLWIVHVQERVIVCSRPLWEMKGAEFVRPFVGPDSECESTLIALLEMNGFV